MRLGNRGRSGRPGSQGSGRSSDRGRAAWGGPWDGVAGGGREVREGPGSGGLNSRIVTIIFETENLFFSARGGYSTIFCWGIRGAPAPVHGWGQWSAGGLGPVRTHRPDIGILGHSPALSQPALIQPGPGLRCSGRVCPAGCHRRPVRVPVPRPARAGALPRCAGAARRLPLCPGNRLPAAATSRLKRFSPSLPAYSLPRSRPHLRHPPCAGPARRSRPVSTLPRAAAPGGPARVGGVGPHGPFPARLTAAPAGGRDGAAGPVGSPGPGWVVLQGGLEGPDRPIGFAPRLSGGQTATRARRGTGIR